MKAGIFYIFITLLVSYVTGRPTFDDVDLDQAAHKYSKEIISGNMSVQEAVKKFVDEYKDRLQYHSAVFAAVSAASDSTNDTCKELKPSLNQAQTYANEGALLALHLTADMFDAVSDSVDCLDINIFKAINCAAHKLQNGTEVYRKYKPELVTVGSNLSNSLMTVFSELVACFKQI